MCGSRAQNHHFDVLYAEKVTLRYKKPPDKVAYREVFII